MFGIFRKARRSNKGTTALRARLGINQLETRAVPSAAALVGDTLMVKGTDAGESISVQVNDPRFGGPANLAVVYSDGAVIGRFAMNSINRIEIHAGGGNDKVAISDQIKLPAILDGGAGDDSLMAGSGSTVLVGGDGNDTLIGGPSRDVLIGGAGADSLFGNGGDDILIAGATKYENDPNSLLTIQKIWNGDDSYEGRVGTLRKMGVANTSDSAGMSTVANDGADHLSGGEGRDWFIGGPGVIITDLDRIEFVN
jgi:Ca2+-binding RTX toxin-like protein